jgi:hypothetical protein
MNTKMRKTRTARFISYRVCQETNTLLEFDKALVAYNAVHLRLKTGTVPSASTS